MKSNDKKILEQFAPALVDQELARLSG